MKEINQYLNYLVYEDGRIFSKARGKFLLPDTSPTGYQRVTLSKDGLTKRFLVHRLVAEHYIDNPEEKKFVNHIDNNPSNNHKDNLEWCTSSENMMHSHKQGRCSNKLASDKAREIMIQKQESKFRELLKERFINYKTENKRGLVKYYCKCCNKVTEVRSDSILLKKDGVCNSCSRKKKI